MFANVEDLKHRKIRVNLMQCRAVSQDEKGNAVFEYPDKMVYTLTPYEEIEKAIFQIETYYCF